jgi:hypothetical protein
MKQKMSNEQAKLKDQFDIDGKFVCPTCKKSLNGIHTSESESLVALSKHTTQKHKVQCCSEECSAKFFEKQLKTFEE